jgi:hypothetical protein
MDFAEFQKSSPARSMFRRLGFIEYLDAANSFRMLRSLIVDYNDNKERGAFVDAAKRADGTCSSGERILLHAILYLTDFAWLADELDKEAERGTWQSFNRVSGDHRRAVVACIAVEA